VPGILLVDEQALFRDCLTALLRRERPGWNIVDAMAAGLEPEQAVREMRPDVVLVDLTIPGGEGFDVLRRLGALNRAVRVVILSDYRGADLARKCRRAGARGYLLKSDSPATLIEAVEAVLRGGQFFSGSSFAEDSLAGGCPERPARLLLTGREFEVFRELAFGKPNKVIAGNLGMSIRTVEAHRKKIHTKLGTESIGELVSLAVREKVAQSKTGPLGL